jgi:lysine 2,3-aminomutase
MPNYLVSASDDAVVLRNFEGMLVRYQAEDKPNTVQPTATRGVSSLLQGTKTVLMPENSERMARRRLHVLENLHESNGNGHDPSGARGHTHGNGHTNGNGCCGGQNGHTEGEGLPGLNILGNGCCGAR